MRHVMIFAAPAILAACATSATYNTAQYEEAQAEVQERLAGYAPVGTRSCLPTRSIASQQIYADGTILVRQGGRIYGQNLGPGCASASSVHTALVTEGTFGTMCSGTIARVIDNGTGMYHGSCAIGEWTTYEQADTLDGRDATLDTLGSAG